MFPLPSLTQGAGSSLQAAGGAAGPSRSDNFFDSSNWTVATGGGRTGFDAQTLMILAGIALAGLVLWKKL